MTVARLAVAAGLLIWVGATLILSSTARVRRPALNERLKPFHPGAEPGRSNGVAGGSPAQILVPLIRSGGDRVAAAFGVDEPLSRRLRRVHSSSSPGTFRMRQAAWSAGGAVGAAMAATAASVPPLIGLAAMVGAALLAFLAVEQSLARRSERWQHTLQAELPVVAEQLAMLVNAGFSTGAALQRLGSRGRGCAAADLRRVTNGVAQGRPEADALAEWADVAALEPVSRLVGVLTLHATSADLGRLLTTEARQCRRDLHRLTIERIERRSQQVWIPVTVATLVPGAILLAVPFLSALRLFANA